MRKKKTQYTKLVEYGQGSTKREVRSNSIYIKRSHVNNLTACIKK